MNFQYNTPLETGGARQTVMHPVVLVALILAVLLILVLPRKRVMVPFLIVAILAPFGEQLYIGGFHFFVLRILVLTGWLRIAYSKLTSRTEILPGGINAMDKFFIAWLVFRVSAALIQSGSAELAYECGFMLDALGTYSVVRFFIRDQEDIIRLIKTLAPVALLLGICMLNEHFRLQNIFGYLGGVPIVPNLREGAARAQGPFGHAILAGTFAAALVPLFMLLWKCADAKLWSAIGIIGATLAVFSSSSSTPLLTYMAAVGGTCMWLFRKRMRLIRWGIVGLLVALSMVMKAPVWFLISHVDLVAGNSGWERAFQIDTCIRHFSDWWLFGTNNFGTWGWDMWDLSNQFVQEAELGGLATFICFVGLISAGFSYVGKARKAMEGERTQEWLMWLLGVTLFCHVVAFFGISYWDQNRVTWYALFAGIAAVCVPLLAGQREPEPAFQFAKSNARIASRQPVPAIPNRFHSERAR